MVKFYFLYYLCLSSHQFLKYLAALHHFNFVLFDSILINFDENQKKEFFKIYGKL